MYHRLKMMSHVENRSFWWILELIYILYLSRRCLVSQLKDLSNQSKKAPEIGENATREREKRFSALWRQRGLSGGRGDQGPNREKDRWSDRETDSSSTKTIIISFKIHVISFARNIRKGSWLNKGHFWHDFRVILGSFPDQTPNRAVTAKVTFMVTYEFKKKQCRKIIYGSFKIVSKK